MCSKQRRLILVCKFKESLWVLFINLQWFEPIFWSLNEFVDDFEWVALWFSIEQGDCKMLPKVDYSCIECRACLCKIRDLDTWYLQWRRLNISPWYKVCKACKEKDHECAQSHCRRYSVRIRQHGAGFWLRRLRISMRPTVSSCDAEVSSE